MTFAAQHATPSNRPTEMRVRTVRAALEQFSLEGVAGASNRIDCRSRPSEPSLLLSRRQKRVRYTLRLGEILRVDAEQHEARFLRDGSINEQL
jgi:hypothetical protein